MIRKNTLRQFVAVFILTVLTISTATAQEPDTYIEELRGVWITNVDSDVLSSKQKLPMPWIFWQNEVSMWFFR